MTNHIHKSTDMTHKFHIRSLTELFDSFDDNTLYKPPTAIKADTCDEITTVEQHYQSNTAFFQNRRSNVC